MVLVGFVVELGGGTFALLVIDVTVSDRASAAGLNVSSNVAIVESAKALGRPQYHDERLGSAALFNFVLIQKMDKAVLLIAHGRWTSPKKQWFSGCAPWKWFGRTDRSVECTEPHPQDSPSPPLGKFLCIYGVQLIVAPSW